MTLNYGWVWFDRDVSASAVQIAVESAPEHDLLRGDDPMVTNLYADSRFGLDGGTMVRVWTIRDLVFKTKADIEAFAAKIENTTGTMRFELQVASGVTSTNMEKFDGSNTTYEVYQRGFKGWRRAGPGTNVVRKIRKLELIQGV